MTICHFCKLERACRPICSTCFDMYTTKGRRTWAEGLDAIEIDKLRQERSIWFQVATEREEALKKAEEHIKEVENLRADLKWAHEHIKGLHAVIHGGEQFKKLSDDEKEEVKEIYRSVGKRIKERLDG